MSHRSTGWSPRPYPIHPPSPYSPYSVQVHRAPQYPPPDGARDERLSAPRSYGASPPSGPLATLGYGGYGAEARYGTSGVAFDNRQPAYYGPVLQTNPRLDLSPSSDEEIERFVRKFAVPNREGLYSCAPCAYVEPLPTKTFKRRTDLERHLRTTHLAHTQTQLICPVEGCVRRLPTKGFVRADKLAEHVREVHGQGPPKRTSRGVQGRRGSGGGGFS